MNFLLLQTALAAVKFTPESEKVIRAALGSMLEILKQESFVPLTIREILWGYENPLIELGKSIFEGDNAYPYDEFGLFVGVSIKKYTYRRRHKFKHISTTRREMEFFFLGLVQSI